MTYRNLFLLMTIGVALFFLGCTAVEKPKHKTWVDLTQISENVTRAKAAAGGGFDQVEDNPEETVPEEMGPKIRNLSSKDDSGNSYLSSMKGQKQYNPGKAPEGEGVMLNFDDANIYEVIQVITETLGLSYIIDPDVKGTVNIRSGSKIPNDQLFIIFKKILNINGLDIRSEGGHEYIFVAGKPSSLAIYGPSQVDQLSPSSRLVTQIVPVVHISSAEAQKLIEPYLSEHSVIYNLADQNLLIISDFEGQIIDALMILARLDVSTLSSMIVRLVRVENAPLFDLKDELTEILSALKINKKDHQGVQILPLERVNSLLMVGFNESLLNSAIKWVEELDRAPTEGRDSIYIYNVRNSVASELADLVTSLITDKSSTKSKTTSSQSSKTAKKTVRPPGTTASKKSNTPSKAVKRPTSPAAKAAAGLASMQFAGEPALIADDARNIIMIRALFADYKRVMKLIERLDNLPMQVLVEVLVASVKLTNDLKYGVAWAVKNNQTKIRDAGISFNLSGGSNTALNLAFDSSLDVFKLLDFIATDGDVSVLSSPQVLVLNNETASVNVGSQVPIVTSDQLSDTGTSANRTVQYKDTGVILNVTPRINYNGIILLEIDQQVSSVASVKTGGLDSPTIDTKQIKTKIAVKDGQAILMGGMIGKDVTESESGIPMLKDIPYFGGLFRTKTFTNSQTELLIMVTPYVIESESVLDQYISSFKEKIIDLRAELDK